MTGFDAEVADGTCGVQAGQTQGRTPRPDDPVTLRLAAIAVALLMRVGLQALALGFEANAPVVPGQRLVTLPAWPAQPGRQLAARGCILPATATVADWRGVPGISAATAAKLVAACHGAGCAPAEIARVRGVGATIRRRISALRCPSPASKRAPTPPGRPGDTPRARRGPPAR